MWGRELILGLVVAVTAGAEPRTFASGEARTHLIELFTSEGCSSCPPAERWLGALRGDPGLWRDFVPVAFHVTYWDRLGWPDRLARRAYTDRQYAYAAAWRADTVYTPGLVLDGREWRVRGKRPVPGAGEAAGRLTVTVADGRLTVQYAPTDGAGRRRVHLALLGGGIVSEVKAGENRGETLAHDFVVLALTEAELPAAGGEYALPAAAAAGETRRALAVWVTDPGGSEPRQATGGWLD